MQAKKVKQSLAFADARIEFQFQQQLCDLSYESHPIRIDLHSVRDSIIAYASLGSSTPCTHYVRKCNTYQFDLSYLCLKAGKGVCI